MHITCSSDVVTLIIQTKVVEVIVMYHYSHCSNRCNINELCSVIVAVFVVVVVGMYVSRTIYKNTTNVVVISPTSET